MIKVSGIAYVMYSQPDLGRMQAFLADFGMVKVKRTAKALYMRGAGPAPYIYVAEKAKRSGFLGFALSARSRRDLDRVATMDGASAVEAIGGPGGGERVTLRDPDGYRIDIVHGIAPAAPLKLRDPLDLNGARRKLRRGATQRPKREPARIWRLGHVALNVGDFARASRFYCDRLGFRASDLLYDGKKSRRIGGFMRVDRGAGWVDHHSVALFQAPSVHAHHASFEVEDYDAVAIGHEWLKEKGWKHFWGVGRHILGSQVFDYWRDPYGNTVEHYADGDLCQAATKSGVHHASLDVVYQWGPKVPASFFD